MPAVAMALPSDKPPSYEEATGNSLVPGSENHHDALPTADCTDETRGSSSLPCPPATPRPEPLGAPVSLPCPLPNDAKEDDTRRDIPEALALAKAQEATSSQQAGPPPAGWVLQPTATPKDDVASARAKALEAWEGSTSSAPPGWLSNQNGTPNKAQEAGESPSMIWEASCPSGSHSKAQEAGDGPGPSSAASGVWGAPSSLYPPAGQTNSQEPASMMSGVWGPPSVGGALCPAGLEPALNVGVLLLRESFRPSERGGSRRGAVVLAVPGAEAEARPLFLVQRGGASSRGHGGHHRRSRMIELLDAAGAQVAATFESTKRSELMSVEVLCPPGSRIARVETRPAPADPEAPHPLLAATVMSAAEQPVFHLAMPLPGALESQPMQQIMSAASGGSVGAISWAWAVEADLVEAELRVPADLDVRMKIALIALCLLSMEAFGRRWSVKEGSGRSLKQRGHRHRRHH